MEKKSPRLTHVDEFGIIGRRGIYEKDSIWWDHTPAYLVKQQMDSNIWNDYFKFCIMRNPFDKIVSHFFFKKEKYIENKSKKEIIDYFRNNFQTHFHFINEDKLIYTIDQKFCVDYFIMYEDLLNGIENVCNNLNVPFNNEIPKIHVKNAKFKHILSNELYTKDLINKVKDNFNQELTIFNYKEPELI